MFTLQKSKPSEEHEQIELETPVFGDDATEGEGHQNSHYDADTEGEGHHDDQGQHYD